MQGIAVLAAGLVALVFLVFVVGRGLRRFSGTKAREDLTVSRAWLVEHQGRTDGD
jgi:hypothetical protein